MTVRSIENWASVILGRLIASAAARIATKTNSSATSPRLLCAR